MKNLITFIITILFLSACENLNEPLSQEFKVSVNCILNPEKKEQNLFLYRTTNISEQINHLDYSQYFIKGASVNLYSDDLIKSKFLESTELVLDPKYDPSYPVYLPYSYKGTTKLIAGEKYNIKIKISDLSISGETIVPGDFKLNILSRDTMKLENLQNLKLEWSESKGAGGYLQGIYIASTSDVNPELNRCFPDTLEVAGVFTKNREKNLDLSLQDDPVWGSVDSVLVYVTAVDSNYVDCKFNGYTNAGLNNSYGLFASSLTKKAVIIVNK